MSEANGEKKSRKQQIRGILETLACLQGGTEDHLFLWDFVEKKIYFAGDISEYLPLEKRVDEGYSMEEWCRVIYKPDLVEILGKMEPLMCGERDTQNAEYRLLDREGNTVWIKCEGKMIRDGLMVGRHSERGLKRQIDPMTGLMNSAQMHLDLEEALKEEKAGYLLIFGMDDFKNINTSYGRSYGNRILQRVGRCLEECMGDAAHVYRLDGDRFAAILPEQEEQQIQLLFRQLQRKLLNSYTISAGAVRFPMEKAVDGNTLFQYSEISLDQAKKDGKNKLMFFSAQRYEKYLYKIDLVEEIRRSVKNDFLGFELYFQPQISKNGYEVCGAEALLRYQSYYHGMISPEVFIPILEQTGLIIPVGKWVIDHSLRQCSSWRAYKEDFVMSINLSYIQLQDETLGNFIRNELSDLKLPGNAIILELTESMQLQDFAEFNRLFYKIGKFGIRIAIDDFGTGYSSLSYLKSLEIDEIKIDRCFVNQIQSSAYNYRLLSNILELAYGMHIQVCCEGVESEEELAILERLKPEKIQGYLFGKPVPAEEFEENFLRDTVVCREQEEHRRKLYINMQYTDSDQPAYGRVDNELSRILDEMDAMVYISDMQTHEIYYLNQTGKRLTGTYDYKGRKCYKVLQGRKDPCDFCTNHLLQEHVFYNWSAHNYHLNCRMKMKDKLISWKGKTVRMGMAIKISDAGVVGEPGEDITGDIREDIRGAMDTDLLKAIHIYHENNDFYEGVRKLLAFVGDCCRAERSYVFIYNPAEDMWENMHEWYGAGAEGESAAHVNVRGKQISRWMPLLEKGEIMRIEEVDSLRESSSKEWRILKQKGINRLLICPLVYDGKLRGFIGIDNAKNQVYDSDLLSGVAKYLSVEFVRYGYYDAVQRETGDPISLMQDMEILELTQMGLWSIEIDTRTGQNRMYMDGRMKRLVGVDRELSPQEAYDHWYGRINDGYYKYIATAIERILEGKEIVSLEYTWNHPELGEVPVRCVGKLCGELNGVYTVKGYHTTLSDLLHMRFLDYYNAPEVFEFNDRKHTIYFHTDRNLIDGRAKKEDGFPYSWIRRGIVHPYFIDEFEQMFTDVKERTGNQSGDMLLRNKEKEFAWYHVETRHLGESEQDIHTLIVILHPIMEKRDVQLQHIWKDDFYRAMLSETIAFLELDLESGMIQNGGGIWAGYVKEGRELGVNYNEVFQQHIGSVVREEDYETYRAHLDMQGIRERYFAGQETTQYDFLRKMEGGGMLWMQLVIHVFQEKISKNMYALLYLKDIDAVKRKEIEQERAVSRDPLTNVLNRKSFQEAVETCMKRAGAEEINALLLLDLDNFKQINDQRGHQGGDRALVQFAGVLKRTFRKTDLIGRLGGDEFVIFVKNFRSRKVLDARMKELHQQMEEIEEGRIFCSIGIAMVSSGDFDYKTALNQADHAMYSSKRKGKNGYSYYEENPGDLQTVR